METGSIRSQQKPMLNFQQADDLGLNTVELRLERTKTESTYPFIGPLRKFRQKNQSMFTELTSSGDFMPIYIANKIIHVVRSALP